MTANIAYPQLGPDGWTDSSIKVLDSMFSDFYLAEKSQSYFFDDVVSFPHLLQKYQGNLNDLNEAVVDNLTRYFNKAFNAVVVEARESPNTTDSSFTQINIFIEVTDNENKSLNLNKVLQISGTTIQKVLTLNNG
jgi:hypothetical protein